MKWENNYDLSCKILKDPKLFTFPPVTKYITKENKDYDEENKFFQLNSNDEIFLDSQKKESTSLSKINCQACFRLMIFCTSSAFIFLTTPLSMIASVSEKVVPTPSKIA